VTYSNRAKIANLGVPESLLAVHGAVSEAVVRAMAEGARARSAASLALATSGIAGPAGGTPEKPVGLVWFARALPAATVSARCLFSGDREAVRRQAVLRALAELIRLLAATASGADAAGPQR
jgi:nicotinamide-nucleotide amidase